MYDAYEKIEEYFASKYSANTTSRKNIGDFYLSEKHPVNVKSNNVDKKNFSANVISASKLYDFLTKDAENQLSFIFADYKIEDGKVVPLRDSGLIPVEHISWECLSIQAQGLGVIQKKSDLIIDPAQTREKFLEGLRAAYAVFIRKEREKLMKLEKKFGII